MSVISSAGIIDLPIETLSCEVFRYLTPQFLAGRVSLVCKSLRNSVLKRIAEDQVKIIGQAEYGDLAAGLDFEGLVPMNKEAAALKVLSLFAFMDKLELSGLVVGIEDDAGVAIIDIPAGLSFTALRTFPGAEHSCAELRNQLGDPVNSKAYRIMISRHVVVGSRRTPPQKQIIAVNNYKCRLPKAQEICALFLTTFASSSACLYGKGTSTLCHDRYIVEDFTLLPKSYFRVGNFLGNEGFTGAPVMENVYDNYDPFRGLCIVKELSNIN